MNFSSLKAGLMALAITAAATSAHAEWVELSYTAPGFSESFELDTTAGFYLPGGDGYALYFNTAKDTQGNDGFAVIATGLAGFPGNEFATGSYNNSGAGSIFDGVFGSNLYDGVNPVLNVAVGDSFTTAKGATLSVSAVPEISTWAMMLLGFGGLGFAGYRRRVAA